METFPKTVDEAVDVVLSWLSDEDKEFVAANDFAMLHVSLGLRIRDQLGLHGGSGALLKDAAQIARRETGRPEDETADRVFMADNASAVTLRAVQRRLRANAPERLAACGPAGPLRPAQKSSAVSSMTLRLGNHLREPYC
ncbi:MAG: hypothetical protein GX601_18050 [Anaerolineales bacterium]|nr:hypothetical protein [Anaerolineales bacterium]